MWRMKCLHFYIYTYLGVACIIIMLQSSYAGNKTIDTFGSNFVTKILFILQNLSFFDQNSFRPILRIILNKFHFFSNYKEDTC